MWANIYKSEQYVQISTNMSQYEQIWAVCYAMWATMSIMSKYEQCEQTFGIWANIGKYKRHEQIKA